MAVTTLVDEGVIHESSVAIPMRDGVLLYADVWRPDTDAALPVLVARTPYGRDMLQSGLLSAPPADVVRAGYVVVYQDSRGRFESEGDWAPIGVEVDDGYDTVEWAAEQPWSNGRVGMFGASYMGYTQWLAAIARPPHLVAILPEVASAEYWGTWFGTGGALRLAHRIGWAAAVGAAHARRIGAPEPELEELLDTQARIEAVLAGGDVLAERNRRMEAMVEPLFQYRPLRENPLLAKIAPWMADSLAREDPDDPYFRGPRPPCALPHARPPGAARRRLVRHQRERHDRELRRNVGRGVDPRSEARAAPHRRPVAALDAADLGGGRRRLRPERGRRPRADPPRVVRPLAAGPAGADARRAARPHLRDGRERVARRVGVAAGAHRVDLVVPPQRRRRQHERRRRRARARAAR